MRSTVVILVALLWSILTVPHAESTGMWVGDSNGCKGHAEFNAATGNWSMPPNRCEGSSCGPNNTRRCTLLPGGTPGANFTFCGCQDGSPQTPICCYITLDTNSGLPKSNGFCQGQVVPASICDAGSCQVWPPIGIGTIVEGKCIGSVEPEPPPGTDD